MKRLMVCLLWCAVGCSSSPQGDLVSGDEDVTWGIDQVGPVGPTNSPPVLHKVGNKEVAVGQEWSVTLEADDADGDVLTYSVYGDLPKEAKFIKAEGRLVWSPTVAGGPYFVTLVVSDKRDFDSETIELRAVGETSEHAPEFEAVGDQFLKPATPYELIVQASDVDGGQLVYSVVGPLPDGALFDALARRFSWTPSSADAGLKARVTFQVSDGALTDTLEVRMVVQGGDNDNLPPQFEPIPSAEAFVGQKLQFEVLATDPEGKTVTYSVDSQTLPKGAKFSPEARLFQWTPGSDQVGKTYKVKFLASDGEWSVDSTCSILVKGAAGTCQDDEFEPNNQAVQAAEIQSGSFELSICDTALSPVDVDWFVLELAAGAKIEVLINFEHDQGDLDMALFAASDTESPVAYEPGVTDEEKVLYTANQGGSYYLAVFGLGNGTYAQPYEMSVSISTGTAACQNDGKEPNNEAGKATVLSGALLQGDPLGNLMICPGDVDYFKVALKCGDTLYAAADFDGTQTDLDLSLIRAADGVQVDTSAGAGSYETVGVESVGVSGDYLLKVFGVSATGTEGAYSLEVLVESGGSCQPDDLEPNNTQNDALPLMDGDLLPNLNICCDADWFEITGSSGSATIKVTSTQPGAVSAALVKSGSAQVAIPCVSGTCTSTVVLTSAPLFLVVDGKYGASYTLELNVDSGTTSGSCSAACAGDAGGCYCDPDCLLYGDCCPDACAECGVC